MQNWYITPDVIEVKALEEYKVYLKFENGEEKIFDMKNLINENSLYFKLKDKEYFKKVRARKDTIEWENGEDVAPELFKKNLNFFKKILANSQKLY